MLPLSSAFPAGRCTEEWKNMIFTKFYYKILFRVIVLTGSLLLFSYCIVEGLYLRSAYAAAFVGLLAAELISYITKFTHHVNEMLTAIQQRDFTMRFRESDHGELNALYKTLNSIGTQFQKISVEKEIKHRHLENLVAHLRIAVASFDEQENVHLCNAAFRRLNHKVNLQSLTQVDERLRPIIRQLGANETTLVKFHDGQKLLSLSLHITKFKLDQQTFTLVSVQDITNELTAGEIDAWHKLIRVLTHEIMNSITPIVSLSESLSVMIANSARSGESVDMRLLESGIGAIRSRGEGLHAFTKRYRQITQIKEPQFALVKASVVVDEIVLLFKAEFAKLQIRVETIHQTDQVVLADKELLQQALVNLIQNAIDAVKDIPTPSIVLLTRLMDRRIVIEISDNGRGIDLEILDKIFIPFYTTKPSGSGVGLALARQIVLLHKGELIAMNGDKGAVFRIIL
jgi:two-component system, NtrC family, nitrogen regulation sensor histidine kinase NtrY